MNAASAQNSCPANAALHLVKIAIFFAVATVAVSAHSQFVQMTVPGLRGSFQNSLGWADYDNDGRVDFLFAGTIQGAIASELWRNTGALSNAPPCAPVGLTSTVSGDTVQPNWSPAADDHTPAAGLRYDVRVGTAPGAVDIISPEADPAMGWRRVPTLGNLGENLSATLRLPPGQYYWSVQAVDSGFAGSLFATEQQFSIRPLLINPIRHEDGVFDFSFTAKSGASFTAVAATDASVSFNDRTVLGVVPEVSPGNYQFTDSQATNHPRRYYRVRSP